MSTTTHPFTPEEIMAFLDGELTAERSQSVSAHIEQCAECRHVRDTLRNTLQSVSEWTVTPVPAGVEDRVRQALVAIKRVPEHGFLGPVRRLWSRRPFLAWTGAAFAALLLFLGLTSMRYDKMRSSSPMLAVAEKRAPSSRSLVTLATPGTAADSNGVFHGLGDRAQYSITDRLPLNDQQGKVFSDQIPQAALAGPMIARTVSLSIVVKDFDSSRTALDTILARHNGYAAGLNVATPQGAARTLQGSLRIPAPQLVAALAELKALGRVEVETQNGEEVTQQHADLVARLKNSRETEQRLQDVLRTRTGKVKDVLEVEREIERVRGEIEQMEAEQQNLEHRVSFATIDLKLAEEYKAQLTSPAPSAGMQLRNAIVNGFRNASESLLGIILFFAEAGPTLLLWLAILFIPVRLLWKRYQRAYATSDSSLGA
jgi:hypothetical protein